MFSFNVTKRSLRKTVLFLFFFALFVTLTVNVATIKYDYTEIVILEEPKHKYIVSNGDFKDYVFEVNPENEVDEVCSFKIPNPWDKTTLSFYQNVTGVKCTEKHEESITIINNTISSVAPWNCYYRYVQRKDFDDTEVTYTTWTALDAPVTLSQDFFEARCNQGRSVKPQQQLFGSIVSKEISHLTQKPFKKVDEDHPSLFIIGIDSMSRSNVIRNLPRWRKTMKENDFVEMDRHVKHGENTFPNWMAMFAGKIGFESKEFQQEVTHFPNVSFDYMNHQFIWRKFSDLNYVTFMGDDYQDWSIFKRNDAAGFRFQPTDHYQRPFWLAKYKDEAREYSDCYRGKPLFVQHLDYLQRFMDAYENKRKFGIFWTSDLSHENVNNGGIWDSVLPDFFEKNFAQLKNSFVFFVTDHGQRTHAIRSTYTGGLEINLPYMAVRVPDNYKKKYPHLHNNLKLNSAKMTTKFDMHRTLLQITEANYNNNYRTDQSDRGTSLFTPIRANRTCKDVKIASQYCPCVKEEAIPINDTVISAANTVIDYFHREIDKNPNEFIIPNQKCGKLILDHVRDVHLRYINGKVKYHLIIVIQPPSRAIFDAILEKTKDGWIIDTPVERTTLYHEQSDCVTEKLKRMCYCTAI